MFGGSGPVPDGSGSLPDTHDQTLRATRVRQITDIASAEVATAAEPESTIQLSANTATIRK